MPSRRKCSLQLEYKEKPLSLAKLRVTSEHHCLQQWEDLQVGGRCWMQNSLPSEELISKAIWITQANRKWPCPLVALSYEKGAILGSLKNYPIWGWLEACETDELKAHSLPTPMGKDLSKPLVKDTMAKKLPLMACQQCQHGEPKKRS